MKIKYPLLIFVLVFTILFASKVYAFDIKDYFNYDILRARFRGAGSAFQQSGFDIQNQELFQKLTSWLYQATGINLQRIWTDASGLIVGILRWFADMLSSLR